MAESTPRPAIGRFAASHRGYAVSRSVAQLTARPFASATTLTVLAIVLTLPALLLFGAGALAGLIDRNATQPSLTAYLDPALADLEGARLATEVANRPGIANTRYLSRDEALATLADGSDLQSLVDDLEQNPLPGSIVVYPTSTPPGADGARERMSALADEIRALPGVERVQYDLVWVERLGAAIALLRIAAGLLSVLLIVTALLVIGNTIRLELMRRRDERDVADLLGADRAFRDRPFLYTGALFGLTGGLLALVLALAAWGLLQGPVNTLAGLYGREALLSWPSASRLALVPLVALLLGVAGALFSLYGPSRVKIHAGT